MKKEYKYTINGNEYEVAIGEIVENEAVVTVNGEEYKVAWEPEAEPEKKVVVRPVAQASESSEASESGSATTMLLRLHFLVLSHLSTSMLVMR